MSGLPLTLSTTFLLGLVLHAPLAAEVRLTAEEEFRRFARERLDGLADTPDRLADAPLRVLQGILKAEVQRLRDGTRERFARAVRESHQRLRETDDRALMALLVEDLQLAGRIAAEEIENTARRLLAVLRSMDERLAQDVLEEMARATLIKELDRLRDAKLKLVEANAALNGGGTLFAASHRDEGFALDARPSHWYFPSVTVKYHEEFARALLERELAHRFGTLTLTTAKLEGLYDARLGLLRHRDAFGRHHEGLGASFTFKTRFTATNARGNTPDLKIGDESFSIAARVNATLWDLATHAELRSTTLVTPYGVTSHNEVTAGAGARSELRIPIELNLFLVKVRITPYASAHAGTSVEAHANIEVEWDGRLLVDVGAAASFGTGAGVGFVLELELSDMVRRVIRQVQEWITEQLRPLGERLAGRIEKGPVREGPRLALPAEELERHRAEGLAGEVFPPGGLDRAQVAARYAPVLYQDVGSRELADYLHRVDYDGDRDGENNWENLDAPTADHRANVYWSIRETRSHYFITYVFYHPRRLSWGLPFFHRLFEHEHSMKGALVVARKGAARGREVVLVETYTGDGLLQYRPELGDEVRPGHESFEGRIRFVDEADHPFLDLDRTHPQLWIDSHAHGVYGYNGRDDRDGFKGGRGVVYYPTGQAEAPEDPSDRMVGYALLPMKEELYDRREEGRLMDHWEDLATGQRLPTRLRGDNGLGSAWLPWGWEEPAAPDQRGGDDGRDPLADEREARRVKTGEVVFDPAGMVQRRFAIQDLSTDYMDSNPFEAGPPRRPDKGITAVLGEAAR
ncbi:MAG: hypothetical protein HY722_00015 [Planctomycetes bacterium]|nr:hypothetical protein [Planctomycetota bacterium]